MTTQTIDAPRKAAQIDPEMEGLLSHLAELNIERVTTIRAIVELDGRWKEEARA